MKNSNVKMLLFSTIAVLALSCNSGSKETEKNNETPTETTVKAEHNHDEHEEIVLNNGEKWKVDDNMMEHIRNMEKDVVAFGKDTKKDYAAISKKLLANIDLLTSNCTMTGKAHDELHKWLLPYIDLVGELEAAENDEKAAEFFEEVEHSFHTFNEYFK